jgi:hypothetical protein
MKYIVYITIHNSFDVEAKSEEEASQKVRELGVYQTLRDCDFNVTEVEKLEENGSIHSSSTSSMEVE